VWTERVLASCGTETNFGDVPRGVPERFSRVRSSPAAWRPPHGLARVPASRVAGPAPKGRRFGWGEILPTITSITRFEQGQCRCVVSGVIPEAPRSLTMPDAEPVSVWEPRARTCECPAVLTRRVHQTRPEQKPSNAWSTSATWMKIDRGSGGWQPSTSSRVARPRLSLCLASTAVLEPMTALWTAGKLKIKG